MKSRVADANFVVANCFVAILVIIVVCIFAIYPIDPLGHEFNNLKIAVLTTIVGVFLGISLLVTLDLKSHIKKLEWMKGEIFAPEVYAILGAKAKELKKAYSIQIDQLNLVAKGDSKTTQDEVNQDCFPRIESRRNNFFYSRDNFRTLGYEVGAQWDSFEDYLKPRKFDEFDR